LISTSKFIKYIQVTMQDLQKGWKVFKASFSVDSSEEPIYMMTRYRFGSVFATGIAFYNLFLIRQRIIKNAIALTKSNNPKMVKGMCFVVGSIYYLGLYCLWHIPSFFAEIAVRSYISTEDAVTTIALKNQIEDILINDKRLKRVLLADGLKNIWFWLEIKMDDGFKRSLSIGIQKKKDFMIFSGAKFKKLKIFIATLNLTVYLCVLY